MAFKAIEIFHAKLVEQMHVISIEWKCDKRLYAQSAYLMHLPFKAANAWIEKVMVVLAVYGTIVICMS